MNVERRRSPRVEAPDGAEGVIRSTVPVHISDISSDGLKLHVSTPLRPGTVYALQVQLPGLRLNVQIRITRCKAGGYAKDGRGGQVLMFSAGSEFIWANPEGSRELEAWLTTRAALGKAKVAGSLTEPPYFPASKS